MRPGTNGLYTIEIMTEPITPRRTGSCSVNPVINESITVILLSLCVTTRAQARRGQEAPKRQVPDRYKRGQ